MKVSHFIILAALLLLGQWGGIHHAYDDHDHDHEHGPVCDYCLSIKSLEHFSDSPTQIVNVQYELAQIDTNDEIFVFSRSIRLFSVRAPPLTI